MCSVCVLVCSCLCEIVSECICVGWMCELVSEWGSEGRKQGMSDRPTGVVWGYVLVADHLFALVKAKLDQVVKKYHGNILVT